MKSSAALASERRNKNTKKIHGEENEKQGFFPLQSISYCITLFMQRIKRMWPECKHQTFISKVMRDQWGSVSVHPNERRNIPRHPRLENKDDNEGRAAVSNKTMNKASCILGNSTAPNATIMDFSIFWVMRVVTGFSAQQCAMCFP